MPQYELDKALAQVDPSRRELLKRLLVGTAATGAVVAAIPLMTTEALAQKEGADPGAGGKCDDGLVVSKKTGKCMMPKKKKAD